MTLNKGQPHEQDDVVTAVPDTDMITAIGIEEKPSAYGGGGGVGAPGKGNEAPIPLGHSRFYCSKCRSVSEERRVGGQSHPFCPWEEDGAGCAHLSLSLSLSLVGEAERSRGTKPLLHVGGLFGRVRVRRGCYFCISSNPRI
jgi:hypothetical protein